MRLIELEEAHKVAANWIAAWNAHDLEVILSHYADELEFVSPLVVSRLGEPDGTIRTKSGLRAYFSPSIGHGSDLHFQLLDVLAGVSSITLCYRNHRQQRVAEAMFLNKDWLVTRAYIHHHPQGS